MLTLPRIVERAETHYVAISEEVTMPFDAMIGPVMDEVEGYLTSAGVEFGPAVFRYDVIDMPRLEIQFGFFTAKAVASSGRIKAGVLPAGRYVTVTYFGSYDDLESVTAVVIGWARQKGIAWDSEPTESGERFAGRAEVYINGPMDEPDPSKLETQIFIKVKD